MEIRAEKLETLNTTADEEKPSDIWAWLAFAGAILTAIGALGKVIS
jgi:hypothetical protein